MEMSTTQNSVKKIPPEIRPATPLNSLELTRAQLKSIGTVGGATSSFGTIMPFVTISVYTCLMIRKGNVVSLLRGTQVTEVTGSTGKVMFKQNIQFIVK